MIALALPWIRRLWGVVAFAAVLVISSLTYQQCRGPNGLAPAVRDSVVALKVTRASDSAAHAAVAVKAETALAESTTLTATSRRTEQHAKDLRVSADSAARLAEASRTAQDSAQHYREAYLAERKHGDSMLVALASAHAATAKAEASALYWKDADSLSRFRLGRVEKLNADLVKDVERISSGCRLLPGIPCPSRKVTAAGVALATYLVVKK